jgi:hypothetical protein
VISEQRTVILVDLMLSDGDDVCLACGRLRDCIHRANAKLSPTCRRRAATARLASILASCATRLCRDPIDRSVYNVIDILVTNFTTSQSRSAISLPSLQPHGHTSSLTINCPQPHCHSAYCAFRAPPPVLQALSRAACSALYVPCLRKRSLMSASPRRCRTQFPRAPPPSLDRRARLDGRHGRSALLSLPFCRPLRRAQSLGKSLSASRPLRTDRRRLGCRARRGTAWLPHSCPAVSHCVSLA